MSFVARMDSLADLGKVDGCKRLLDPAYEAGRHVAGLIHICIKLIELRAELYYEIVANFTSLKNVTWTARGWAPKNTQNLRK